MLNNVNYIIFYYTKKLEVLVEYRFELSTYVFKLYNVVCKKGLLRDIARLPTKTVCYFYTNNLH